MKFHKCANNLPIKNNPLFSNVELEKVSELRKKLYLFLSLFLVYGFKISIILACISSFTSNFRKNRLGFNLNDHLNSLFGIKSTSTQTNF